MKQAPVGETNVGSKGEPRILLFCGSFSVWLEIIFEVPFKGPIASFLLFDGPPYIISFLPWSSSQIINTVKVDLKAFCFC